jgi:adenine-specific DNA methylase
MSTSQSVTETQLTLDIMPSQDELPDANKNPQTPTTRYQGSKLKLSGWLWENLKDLPFFSALDIFGGTGTVSYLLKTKGKKVHYNDYLQFNSEIGRAFIENSSQRLSSQEIEDILAAGRGCNKRSFIHQTFGDIYFTDDENAWLDSVLPVVRAIQNPYKRSMAYYALFQSCIIKRPYNLFHRKNLYVRTSEVERSFGNKVTWDTPFDVHFSKFATEANAAVFDNGQNNISTCLNAADISGKFDLVYMDPPYTSGKGVSVDYHQFYHFLEGLVRYDEWDGLLDRGSKHLRLRPEYNPWNDKKKIGSAFSELFAKFRTAILVVSYRSEGIPSIEEIRERMLEFKKEVKVVYKKNYQYVLSTANNDEVLLIGQ